MLQTFYRNVQKSNKAQIKMQVQVVHHELSIETKARIITKIQESFTFTPCSKPRQHTEHHKSANIKPASSEQEIAKLTKPNENNAARRSKCRS
jgi:hypothetical protein